MKAQRLAELLWAQPRDRDVYLEIVTPQGPIVVKLRGGRTRPAKGGRGRDYILTGNNLDQTEGGSDGTN